jgi:PAS domain S-box-containing protein
VRVRDALKSGSRSGCSPTTSGPIAYLDRACTTFVNQAFANWVCKPQDEIYGKTPFEVMASDVAAFLRPVLKRAQQGEHVEYERIGQNANGQRRWMHGRMAPDLDSTGKVRGLYCTEYDIHDLKQTEQELAAREKQLRLFTATFPSPSSIWTPSATTCSSTRRSSTCMASPATKCWARNPRKCSASKARRR